MVSQRLNEKKKKKYFKKEKLINVYNAVHRSSKRDMKK